MKFIYLQLTAASFYFITWHLFESEFWVLVPSSVLARVDTRPRFLRHRRHETFSFSSPFSGWASVNFGPRFGLGLLDR